jgi:hypothetical protein
VKSWISGSLGTRSRRAALKAQVNDRLQGIADKYFSRAISSQATFGKGPHDNGFTCDIVMHVMQGLVLKATNRAWRRMAHSTARPTGSTSSCAATPAG